jgi:hypothetical protein
VRSALLCTMVLCGTGLAQPLVAQQCPGGRSPAGDVGIIGLLCRGPAASCAINMQSRSNESARHLFAVEPVITGVDEDTDLRVGDTLVAIDSLLITTAAGGARMAQLTVDAPIRLLVRRDGELREIRMNARRGCGIGSLRVIR